MHVLRVDPDGCQGHARCATFAPEAFDMDDEGYSCVRPDFERLEVACLRPLLSGLSRPWVCSGRFAAALGVDAGLDPAAMPLALARSRKTPARQGRCSPTPRMTHTPRLTGPACLRLHPRRDPNLRLRSTAASVATGAAFPWKRHP
jgi:hypothetical protein